jgi:hypothetical protein
VRDLGELEIDQRTGIGSPPLPAPRVALSRAYYFIPSEQSHASPKVLATGRSLRRADIELEVCDNRFSLRNSDGRGSGVRLYIQFP